MGRIKMITAVCLLALLPLAAMAQDHLLREDTAARIVDRYLQMMGIERLPADSLLVLETTITSPNSTDTFVMRRWFAQPQMQRVEVWHGKKLQTGLCTNGKDRFRRMNHSLGYWVDLPPVRFYEQLMAYDFRGPLYNWRANNAVLTYNGPVTAPGGQRLESVKVEASGMFTRYYMFEESGLLSVLFETDEMLDRDDHDVDTTARIEWKCMHEYQQVGTSLLPRLESFLRGQRLTVMETTARLEPLNTLIFNEDRRGKK
ncbi:MAG: hypothetical protein IKP83_01185 [Bacteroidales bacterium]|nr:hypothetical protein [Bacteroidales bacterium]